MEDFLAQLRQEAQSPKNTPRPSQQQPSSAQDKQGAAKPVQKDPEGIKDKAPATSKTSEDVHGGDEATKDIPDSPNAADDGQNPDNRGAKSGTTGDEGAGQEGQGQQSGKPGTSGSPSGGQGSQQSQHQAAGGSGGQIGHGRPAGSAIVKSVVSQSAVAQWLAVEHAAQMFRTTKGLESGAELAAKLVRGERLDFESADGKTKVWARGEKAQVQAAAETARKLVEDSASTSTGQSTTGGAIAGKAGGPAQFSADALSPAIRSVLPQLRALGKAGVVEVLKEWTTTPPQQRTRVGAEYQLLKGFVELAALEAVSAAEEVEDSEQSPSPSGERLDVVQGPFHHLALDEERTLANALECGGLIDDDTEVHEVRVRTDAPQIMFVVDGSGSMAHADRMMCAAVAAAATAQKYGPLGATFGLIVLTSQPSVVVRMPETEVAKIVDAVFSIKPTWGTAYAPAIELALRHSPPKTTVVILGDFEDSGLLSTEALALKAAKEIKLVGIVASEGHPDYAAMLCDEVHLVSFTDPTSVALVAVKASK